METVSTRVLATDLLSPSVLTFIKLKTDQKVQLTTDLDWENPQLIPSPLSHHQPIIIDPVQSPPETIISSHDHWLSPHWWWYLDTQWQCSLVTAKVSCLRSLHHRVTLGHLMLLEILHYHEWHSPESHCDCHTAALTTAKLHHPPAGHCCMILLYYFIIEQFIVVITAGILWSENSTTWILHSHTNYSRNLTKSLKNFYLNQAKEGSK